MGMVEFSQAELTFSPVEYYELVHLRRGPTPVSSSLRLFFFRRSSALQCYCLDFAGRFLLLTNKMFCCELADSIYLVILGTKSARHRVCLFFVWHTVL